MNGLNSLFMIQSVMATEGPVKYQGESKTPTNSESKRSEESSLFAEILGVAIKEVK